ncbi:molybdopterin molybdotransferase MoeA [Aliikangiella maris]|uniref:Molybdopterin molybdotransferase MoeA n=2 Tax=Aliikangiella maris TaxID=3162458 RepID=A0ABV2BPK2_9GAMM
MNDNKDNPYTENYLIEFSQALDLINQHASPIEQVFISLDKALTCVAAQDINTKESVPPFNNSAMDGYAVNARDLVSASQQSPVKLSLLGTGAAGEDLPLNIDSNECQNKAWKIMTGAPVPSAFDSVIPIENTQLENNSVLCFSPVKVAANIRYAGEDFQKDQPLIKKGEIINTNKIMALTAQGIGNICVYQRPSIALFATGKELVDHPEQTLKPGQIRNSNTPYMVSWLKSLPVDVYNAGTNHDDSKKFADDLTSALNKNTNIIISSGAVSMGDFDFIPKIIKQLGGQIIFHKIKIKPGKPILFAKFPNGTFYFGLPGNPISANLGLRFFVFRLIQRLLAQADEKPVTAICNEAFTKRPGFAAILKSFAQINQHAQLTCNILPGQESFKIKPLLNANGWIYLKESTESLATGEKVEFYPTIPYWF